METSSSGLLIISGGDQRSGPFCCDEFCWFAGCREALPHYQHVLGSSACTMLSQPVQLEGLLLQTPSCHWTQWETRSQPWL